MEQARGPGYDRSQVHALVLVLLAAGGPLGLRTQGPLRELFLDMTGADARPIDHSDFDIRWSVANTWNEQMSLQRGGARATQLLDEQADSLTLRVRAPWPDFPGIWTAIEWKITEHWGGWSDTPIESWHSLVGAFNYQRSQFPRNRVRLIYADDGGTAFDIRSAKLAPGDLTARTQIALVANHARSQALASTPAMRGRVAAIVTTVGFAGGAVGSALGNLLAWTGLLAGV